MAWLQLHIITAPQNTAATEDAMMELGAITITLEDNSDQPIFEPKLGETPLWPETRIIGLFNADSDVDSIQKAACKRLDLPMEQASWHVLEDKDWEREWMTHYQPIQLSDHFWVCPSWTPPPDPLAVNLRLDPGLAFGTGTHPTTFLCLQWLAEQDINGCQVLDYGCGSGILGIAALLLGASNVQGVDIDPQALIATHDNVTRNSLSKDRFPVCLPADCPESPADIVIANILAGPLVELAPSLIERLQPNGALCLSGVLLAQEHAIKSAYESQIDFHPSKEKDGWICLIGEKRR